MATFLKVGFAFAIVAHVFLALGYGLEWGVPSKSSTVIDQLLIALLFCVMYVDVRHKEEEGGI